MKHLLFVVASTAFSVASHCQSARADVSITSLILDPRYRKPAIETLEKLPAESQNVTTNPNTTVVIPGKEKPLPHYFKCTIVVQNANVDKAHEVRVVAIFPGEVAAQSITANGTLVRHVYNSPHPGYIEFKIPELLPARTATLEFTFLRSVWHPNRISAFVFSSSSDPNPLNNYKEAVFQQ